MDWLESGDTPALLLDPRAPDPMLEIAILRGAGHGTTVDRSLRLELVFPLPDTVDAQVLNERLSAGAYQELLERIVDGFEAEWNGRKRVGVYTPDAESAIKELQALLDGLPVVDVLDHLPEEFSATVIIEISYDALVDFCGGSLTDDEYASAIETYAALTESEIGRRFPSFEVICRTIRGRDPDAKEVLVTPTQGGRTVANRVRGQVLAALTDLDRRALAEQSVG